MAAKPVPRARWRLRVLVGLSLLVAGIVGVRAFVHDGKSFAIEAALPELEQEGNPFVLREDWWDGEFESVGETKLIQHHLFKRNEYWFWLGFSNPDSSGSIHIYDSEGNLTEAESWQNANVAGARIVPESTGSYYIRVKLEKGPDKDAGQWAVIYGFR